VRIALRSGIFGIGDRPIVTRLAWRKAKAGEYRRSSPRRSIRHLNATPPDYLVARRHRRPLAARQREGDAKGRKKA